MQINLKQAEIEQALKAYVVAQGISLQGKDIAISFTAGRRESGISAEVTIEDVIIPGFTNPYVEEAVESAAEVIQLAATSEEAPVVEAPVEAEEAPNEAKVTNSLFS